MEDLQHISRGLYEIVKEIAGPEHVIKMNQDLIKLENAIQMKTSKEIQILFTGSFGEGIRFKSSDIDSMVITKRGLVVSDPKVCLLMKPSTAGFYMETAFTRPGFVLLEMIKNSNILRRFSDSSVIYLDKIYLSSKQWRENVHDHLRTSTSQIHGPCTSDVIGDKEVDYAYCLHGNFWPPQANECIHRMRNTGWPAAKIIDEIVNGGCHFVPIGAKMSHFEHVEWRLSFSLAETTIIHSMNYFQFLTYCLLKIFLKEVINQDKRISDCLCSYFLKTALFWEIQSNPQFVWNAESFIFGFWKAFSRIISWVKNGYCPNFFITQNNMFVGKIRGEKQEILLSVLVNLYKEGYQCLLQSPSLRPSLFEKIIKFPGKASVPFDKEENYLSKFFNLILIKELGSIGLMNSNDLYDYVLFEMGLQYAMSTLSTLERKDVYISWLQRANSCELGLLLLGYYLKCGYVTTNKQSLRIIKKINNMLSSGGCYCLLKEMSIATYFCRLERMDKAIDLLQIARKKLDHPHSMYRWYMKPIRDLINIDVLKLSKTYIIDMFETVPNSAIPELMMEVLALHSQGKTLQVPPLVYIKFMLYLCYQKLNTDTSLFNMYKKDQWIKQKRNDGSSNRECQTPTHPQSTICMKHLSKKILQELSDDLTQDVEYVHVPKMFRWISWQLLGICQHHSGDFHAAYTSYLKSLYCDENNIIYITYIRILLLLLDIHKLRM